MIDPRRESAAFDSPASAAAFGVAHTQERAARALDDGLEEYLAAHEAHGRLVREIAQVDHLISQAQARRHAYVSKLLEVQQVMRENDPRQHEPRRSERLAGDEAAVLATLPARLDEIAARAGIDKARVQQLTTRLRKAGRIRREGRVWLLAGEESE